MRLASLPLAAALFLLLGQPTASGDEALELIARARAQMLDARAAGLNHFASRFSLISHENPDLTGDKHSSFGYNWAAPAAQVFDFEKTPAKWRKTFKDGLGMMWADMTGTLALDLLTAAEEGRALETRGAQLVMIGAHPQLGPLKGRFGKRSKRLEELELVRWQATFKYRLTRIGKRWRVDRRETWAKGNRWLTIRYRGWSKLGDYTLPTRVSCDAGDGFEFSIDWIELNAKPAPAPEVLDAKVLTRTLAAFERGWPRWSKQEKLRQLEVVAELADDRAVEVIAARGLKDRDSEVRRRAAVHLGSMGRAAATRPLLAAIDRHRDDKPFYLQCCWAMGQIGDPDAIQPLVKNWRQHNKAGLEGLIGRIHVVGKTPDKRAVDELLKLVALTNVKEVQEGLWEHVVKYLRELTGEDKGDDYHAWKRWWREARPTFVFPAHKRGG